MKILIDNQVYENQNFGGISRYFDELQLGIEGMERMEAFKPQAPVKKTYYQRLLKKINSTRVAPKQKFPDKYNFYHLRLNRLDFDVFHPTYYDNYFLASLKKPFVLTVHDMIHEKYPEYFGSSPDSINKRRLCEAANKIIAVSETTKKDIIDILGTSEDKIEVIYHATNFQTIEISKPDLKLEKPQFLLYTGNRSLYKNFLTFLIAVAPLLKKNDDLFLVCTGPEFSAIEKKWIMDLEITDDVQQYFCSNDHELAYFYRNAQCFIFPSLYEGFGLPLLEAFACGCPVVSSSGGSLKEIAGDAAVYFDPKDIKSIRNSIYRVLTEEKLREELKLLGQNRLDHFSWDKCRKETMNLYSKLT